MTVTQFPEMLHDAAGVRELDRRAIEQAGIAGETLMVRAGEAAFRRLQEHWPDCQAPAVICGAGNNGGDGYVVALLAQNAGLHPQVYTTVAIEYLRGDARTMAERALAEGVPVTVLADVLPDLSGHDLVVDGLLGTGLSGTVRPALAALIRHINASDLPLLALDIPSGLSADTGAELGAALRADVTATFVGMKRGLLTGAGPALTGQLYFEDLAIPESVQHSLSADCRMVQIDQLARLLPPRRRDAHKGDHGHVLVVGGDHGYAGAVLLAAEAAARSGAGLVSVATRPEHVTALVGRRPEIMVRGVEHGDDLEPLLKRTSVVVCGPGLGLDAWGFGLLGKVLASGLPLVLDADALNLIARHQLHWQAPAVLTPHPGEAARLLNSDSRTVQDDRFAAVHELASRYQSTVLLKGAGTLIGCTDQPVALVHAGNPGMASGGMGDVLSGIIGALLGQGLGPYDAARFAALVHGLAADRAVLHQGERGLLATDLLPHVRRLLNGFEHRVIAQGISG
ncbi:MAG: NAD(P)H-hydrate dehydratase [Alcanivoracaceae bacterium]|jgi:NAD(P)H-hydrate epimerase|nr:NAD(P)H-hydrate dehydratase [Alcanivoracaceae bacterium]